MPAAVVYENLSLVMETGYHAIPDAAVESKRMNQGNAWRCRIRRGVHAEGDVRSVGRCECPFTCLRIHLLGDLRLGAQLNGPRVVPVQPRRIVITALHPRVR